MNIPAENRLPIATLTRVLALASLVILVYPLSACSTGGGSSFDSTGYVLMPADRAMVNALPVPRVSGMDLSGPCRQSTFLYEDAGAQSALPTPGYFMPLKYWAMYHAGARIATASPSCADNELTVKLWQSAIGTPVTGRLSERDVTELVRRVDQVDSRYADAAKIKKMTPDERAIDAFASLAQRGDPKAQYRLGSVYEKQGKLKEATYWYTKAADQGLPLAMEKLGRQPQGLATSSTNYQAYRDSSAPRRENLVERPISLPQRTNVVERPIALPGRTNVVTMPGRSGGGYTALPTPEESREQALNDVEAASRALTEQQARDDEARRQEEAERIRQQQWENSQKAWQEYDAQRAAQQF